jgi:lipoprotein-releasing system permease protein
MFHPLPIFVGLRYVRTRRQGFFVSFISWVSMLGVCVGVAALITIISVMNGFEGELRGRLVAITAHATLEGPAAAMQDWQTLAERARSVPGTAGAAPFADVQAMIGRAGHLQPVMLHGLDPGLEGQVSDVERHMVAGRLADLVPGERHIILGRIVAWQLGAAVGDEITVMVPGRELISSGGRPRLQTFTVSGVFEVGLQEHDAGLALVALEDAAALRGGSATPSGLRLRFDDVMRAPTMASRITAAVGAGTVVRDWTQEHSAYFRAIRIEKTMMSLILLLVVAVAAFNIVAALVMVVNEKRSDIAILRTLGLPRAAVVGVFFTQGIVIGAIGTALGVALGLAIAFNVGEIVPVLEHAFGFHVMDPTVYYITEIPSEVRAGQVLTIGLVAFALTVLATIYPALRGAATEPAEALRYE